LSFIEHAQLTPAVEQFCEYLNAQEDVEAAKAMLLEDDLQPVFFLYCDC
jgi:hypothetical protein